MIGIPGQGQPWETLRQGLDVGHTVEVSDMVLGHSLRVAGEAHAERLATDAEQLPEVLVHGLLYLGIGEGELLLLQGPTNKGAQEHLIVWRPTREFDAAEGASDVGALFDCRYDKAHTVQGMGDIGTLADNVDDGR